MSSKKQRVETLQKRVNISGMSTDIFMSIFKYLDWFTDAKAIREVWPLLIGKWHSRVYKLLNEWKGYFGCFHTVQGVLHDTQGPAAIYNGGAEEWYTRGELDRYGHPAYICGLNISYYKNGLRHNEWGPAVVTKEKLEWWVEGKLILEKESSIEIAKYYRYGGYHCNWDNISYTIGMHQYWFRTRREEIRIFQSFLLK